MLIDAPHPFEDPRIKCVLGSKIPRMLRLDLPKSLFLLLGPLQTLKLLLTQNQVLLGRRWPRRPCSGRRGQGNPDQRVGGRDEIDQEILEGLSDSQPGTSDEDLQGSIEKWFYQSGSEGWITKRKKENEKMIYQKVREFIEQHAGEKLEAGDIIKTYAIVDQKGNNLVHQYLWRFQHSGVPKKSESKYFMNSKPYSNTPKLRKIYTKN